VTGRRIEVANNVPSVFVSAADPVASDNGDVYVSTLSGGTWPNWVKIT
jgi:hypothetical protein